MAQKHIAQNRAFQNPSHYLTVGIGTHHVGHFENPLDIVTIELGH